MVKAETREPQQAAEQWVWPHFWERLPEHAGRYRCQVCGEERKEPVLFGCPGKHPCRPGRLLTLLELRREQARQQARLGR
jgi:hypothetical protein